MSAAAQPVLAERMDIHKSCKSLETLLNVLNDYCEAAGAVVLLQKKLAKALRETANLKVTGEIASNALTASANIFDSMSDVDSKFAKIADKEYDGISGEVKKWFKKLAKEEKAHDDRISTANAKIKQAGLVYEKKSKKNPRDSAEEHARYINLISALGPEISQEKYNHALLVTQRHTSTTYSVAACVSRVADAEWLRSCESVRRFSPTIGPLGEWRSLCEGGWTGPLPPSLVDPDPESQLSGDENIMKNVRPDVAIPSPMYERQRTSSASPSTSPNIPSLAQLQQSSPPSSYDRPRPLLDPNSGSVRSLSAFPPPPSHFPIPSVTSRPPQSQQASSSSSTSTSHVNLPVTPQAETTFLEPDHQFEEPSSIPPSPTRADKSPETAPAVIIQSNDPDIKRPIPVRSQTAESNMDRIASPSVSGTLKTYSRGDYLLEDREFGVSDITRSKNGVGRSDTGGSTGSVVAAMRNRYSHTSGATSPAPKDVPRLPLSVTDLATLYQPADTTPLSPRTRASSPPVVSPRAPIEPGSAERNLLGGINSARPPIASPATPSRSFADQDTARRRTQEQRIDEAAELDFLEKEKALQEKERLVEMRAREVELERANLRNARADGNQRESWDNGIASPKPQLRPRERKTSFRNSSPLPRPQSQLETQALSMNVSNNPAHSQSTTHLVPPSATSQTPFPSSPRSSTEHAPYCGCETCSIAQYKSSSNRAPSPHELRPPEKPFTLRPEKPKGWIRRLSMPVAVGNAFSLDKKSNAAKMYSLDGNKGSATTLRNVGEDGRMGMGAGRRSYDASGVSNRSMTSLVGAGGRR